MKGTIKDPTFDIYNKGGMVENRARPIDKEELMKLADADKEAFDFKQNLIDALREEYKKEGSKLKFEDWIKTKDPDFLIIFIYPWFFSIHVNLNLKIGLKQRTQTFLCVFL